jgi:hypothetical protein
MLSSAFGVVFPGITLFGAIQQARRIPLIPDIVEDRVLRLEDRVTGKLIQEISAQLDS